MDRTESASIVYRTGRILSVLVLLLLVAAAAYAGVMAYTNWSAIGV